jgi:hypothetical protein
MARIHNRKHADGGRRAFIVNNGGLGPNRTEGVRVEVRDNRLPPPFTESERNIQKRSRGAKFSYLNTETGEFKSEMLFEYEAKEKAAQGIPVFYGTMTKDGKPKGIQVKP